MDEPKLQDESHRSGDRLTGLLVLEGIAVAIALAAPVTPSKTGSTWSPAELFTGDPNYIEKVFASFVTVNVIIAVLGLVVWLTTKITRRE